MIVLSVTARFFLFNEHKKGRKKNLGELTISERITFCRVAMYYTSFLFFIYKEGLCSEYSALSSVASKWAKNASHIPVNFSFPSTFLNTLLVLAQKTYRTLTSVSLQQIALDCGVLESGNFILYIFFEDRKGERSIQIVLPFATIYCLNIFL